LPCHRECSAAPRLERPRFEVADVFRAHGEAYRQSHVLSADQLKVMRAIEACRTEVLGGHLDLCPSCGFERPSYNSCRNRHCPKCQSLAQARWIEQRIERILPVHYFHVVFTLPAELRPLARCNRQMLFDLLFAAASQTLLALGDDPARLGGRLGITTVLHTWTRELLFHPHLHCLVTGGGLAPSGQAWLPLSRRYLFPVKVMGALFRGKFLDGLRQLYHRGLLALTGRAAKHADPAAFDRLMDQLYRKSWVVYAKRPFAGPQQVFRYLGRYTHRVALSNHRIQLIDEHGVRFATKDGRSITLPHQVFIGRFLEHVLPSGYTKIRHFGLHASGNLNTKLAQARLLFSSPSAPPPAACGPAKPLPWNELLLHLTGVDPTLCPRCGTPLRRHPLPPVRPRPQDTS
jgi:predicted Zn-ribbon and HTH transcriptional regulator